MATAVRTIATNAQSLSAICMGLGAASILGSIAVWANARGETPEEAAHAERFGIFVGLWAPTFFVLADQLGRRAGGRGGR
jgi:hypothetical protein